MVYIRAVWKHSWKPELSAVDAVLPKSWYHSSQHLWTASICTVPRLRLSQTRIHSHWVQPASLCSWAWILGLLVPWNPQKMSSVVATLPHLWVGVLDQKCSLNVLCFISQQQVKKNLTIQQHIYLNVRVSLTDGRNMWKEQFHGVRFSTSWEIHRIQLNLPWRSSCILFLK